MQKDLKIGLILGMALASVAILWVATRPSLSPQAQMPRDYGAVTASELGMSASPREHNNFAISEVTVPPRSVATGERVSRNTFVRPEAHQRPKETKPQRFHVVSNGETLSEISYAYYGSAGKWRRIFEANRKNIKDANVVMPGTKLVIPN